MRWESIRETEAPPYGVNAVSQPRTRRCAAGGACFPLHWHDCMELLLVREGELELYLDERFAASVLPGEVAVIAPRQTHQCFPGPQGVTYDVTMFVVTDFLNAAPVTQQMLSALSEYRVRFAPKLALPAFTERMEALIRLSTKDPLASVGVIYQLLSLLMQHGQPVERPQRPADERFAAVVAYIDRYATEALSVAELSARFGYDESYFCRRFKRATGLSLLKYVEVLRLEAAQEALRRTNAPVGQIALQCGFADPCYFSSRYRRHFGIRPSKERSVNGTSPQK